MAAQPLFGPEFLDEHAGQIIRDPKVAVIELIANSWDASATRVEVTWPTEQEERFEVRDDGHGMSPDEFRRRWRMLSYQRLREQGPFAQLLDGTSSQRRAFGRNGKGRHGAFCFGDEYLVQTWRDGTLTTAKVRRSRSDLNPFEFEELRPGTSEGHGTRVIVEAARNTLPSVEDVREAVGSRFLVDPGFNVFVNGVQVTLLDISKRLRSKDVEVSGVGTFTVHLIDASEGDRTTRHHGIAWWVNNRLVGDWSWEGLVREGRFLDGRTTEAKRFTFIVVADCLENHVLADWSGFLPAEKVETARRAIHNHIEGELRELLKGSREDKKRRILSEVAPALETVPRLSQKQVVQFVDQTIERCPTIAEKDIMNLVEIVTNLEQSRTGYLLLEQLAAVAPEDLDRLSDILATWSVSDAQRVLDELGWRLKLIQEIETLVDNPMADELHELQPLFARGLWIFGPEYESVAFTSNRSITEVVRQLFEPDAPPQSRKRPDFVMLANSSLGVYGHPRYDAGTAEVVGPDKIVIVELKKGGFAISRKEMEQAANYAVLLRKSGKLLRDTKIEAFVLGASVEEYVEERKEGEHTILRPMAYSTVLSRAHSRTFNLLQSLKDVLPNDEPDLTEVQNRFSV